MAPGWVELHRFILELLDVSEVANLCRIVLSHEDVERLDVAVDDVPRMQVVHPQANVDEDLPKKVVGEGLLLLLLDSVVQVTVLAVLHDDADGLPSDERVVVAHHEVTVNFSHYCDLFEGLHGCSPTPVTYVDLFNDVALVCEKLPRLVRLLNGRVHIDAQFLLVDTVFSQLLWIGQFNSSSVLCGVN